MKKFFVNFSVVLALLALLALRQPARAAVVGLIEGVPINSSATVAGKELVLNGAAVRKRGYFKTDVTALYLTAKRSTLEGVYKLTGPKRIELTVLRELTGSIISKYFISDFKLVTSDEEFKTLINEVGMVGDFYSRVKSVNRGDVVAIDWVPNKGIHVSLNGKALLTNNSTSEYMNSAKMYEVLMRMYLGARATADYRNGLLGTDTHYLVPSEEVRNVDTKP